MARIYILYIYRERKQNAEICVPIHGASKMLRTNGVLLMAVVFHTCGTQTSDYGRPTPLKTL